MGGWKDGRSPELAGMMSLRMSSEGCPGVRWERRGKNGNGEETTVPEKCLTLFPEGLTKANLLDSLTAGCSF
jgi:hypothetical protein